MRQGQRVGALWGKSGVMTEDLPETSSQCRHAPSDIRDFSMQRSGEEAVAVIVAQRSTGAVVMSEVKWTPEQQAQYEKMQAEWKAEAEQLRADPIKGSESTVIPLKPAKGEAERLKARARKPKKT